MHKKNIQQAIVLAAGLGTRLRPLTDCIPKPALPVGGLPIILYNLMLLKESGIRRVTVNLYHQPAVLVKILQAAKRLKLDLTFSFEKKILGTAGGIAQALRKMKDETTLIINGDILTDIYLKKFMESHLRSKALASLVTLPPQRVPVKKYIYYKRNKQIISIDRRAPSGPFIKGIFAGIHILEPQLFKDYPLGQFGCVIRQVYLPAIKKGLEFRSCPFRGEWWDLGKFETLKQVDQKLWQQHTGKRVQQIRRQLFACYPLS